MREPPEPRVAGMLSTRPKCHQKVSNESGPIFRKKVWAAFAYRNDPRSRFDCLAFFRGDFETTPRLVVQSLSRLPCGTHGGNPPTRWPPDNDPTTGRFGTHARTTAYQSNAFWSRNQPVVIKIKTYPRDAGVLRDRLVYLR